MIKINKVEDILFVEDDMLRQQLEARFYDNEVTDLVDPRIEIFNDRDLAKEINDKTVLFEDNKLYKRSIFYKMHEFTFSNRVIIIPDDELSKCKPHVRAFIKSFKNKQKGL